MAPGTNPYLNRTAIRGERDFFGRRRELAIVFSRIGAREPQSVSIVGERRIGKSSLLRALLRQRTAFLDRPDEFVFVYLDLQGRIHGDVSDFFAALIEEIALARQDPVLTGYPPTYESLRRVVAGLNRAHTKLVLLLDEFEAITLNRNFTIEFFSFLRSLPNNYLVSFVVTSARELQEFCHSKEIAGSPFFNIFHKLNLGCLSAEEAHELIVMPSRAAGYSLEAHTAFIHRLAGYFPFFLQLACCAFFERRHDFPNENDPDLNSIRQKFYEEVRNHFEYVWDHFTDRERALCIKVSRHEYLNDSDKSFLGNLSRRGYLFEGPEGVRLFSNVFDTFVTMKTTIAASHVSERALGRTSSQSLGDMAVLCANLKPSAVGEMVTVPFPSPKDAVEAGAEMQRDAAGSVPRKVTIHWGEAVTVEGVVYGDAAQVAEEMISQASPGHVEISEAVLARLEASDANRFVEKGLLHLRGKSHPLRVFCYQVAATHASVDLTGTSVGRFAVRARLGAGGMGEVYLADDTKLKRPVALKRMAARFRDDMHYRKRFLKEAERASQLADPRIAGVHDVLEERGEIFLVMEYVKGQTLRQSRDLGLSLEQFLDIAQQCAGALATAHDKGIIHCDIKPENILITPSGQVKVLDFGLAKYLPQNDTTETATMDGAGLTVAGGTPSYMAPEVWMEQAADARSDIFSLGVVFYEVISGRHPFRSSTRMATADRILRESPAPLTRFDAAIPAELERIIYRCLEKNPNDRYQCSRDLLADFKSLRHNQRYRTASF